MATHVEGGKKTIADMSPLHASPINLLTEWDCTAVWSLRDHLMWLIFIIFLIILFFPPQLPAFLSGV